MNLENVISTVLGIKHQPAVKKAALLLPRWVTPNAITTFGGILVLPGMWQAAFGSPWQAMAWFIAAAAMDALDGIVAEARNMKSETGAFLDPLVDKFRTWGMFLAMQVRMPENAALFFSIAMIAGMFYAAMLTVERLRKMARAKPKEGAPIAANSWGKQKAWWETAATLLTLLGLALPASKWLLFAGLATLVVSLYFAHRSYYGQVGVKSA